MGLTMRQIAVGTTVAGVVVGLAYAARSWHRRQHAETLRDESLRESYPASDAPATQDFDIPVNRQ